MDTKGVVRLDLECWRSMVEVGGCEFVASIDGRSEGMDHLILFRSRNTGLLIGLRAEEVSAERVRAQALMQDALWEEYAEKVCTRIFRQFAVGVPRVVGHGA